MSEQQATPAITEPQATDNNQQQPDINAQLGDALWNGVQPPTQQAEPQQEPPATTTTQEPADDIIAPDEWVKNYYGWENAEAGKKELEELRKLRETAQTPAEIKFANDEAKKYYEAITGGKSDDLYNILHQQRQLDRLEKLPIANANEAAEIIKATLQYKHADLKPEEVNFLYNKRYAIPAKPLQGSEQTDADYALDVEEWNQQVRDKEQEIIIEAKVARPELAKYKSELVLPETIKSETPQGPSQEDLAQQEAFKNNFTQQLKTDTKFKGFTVTAKDGDVELPVSYVISDEEKAAFNDVVQRAVLNINDFLDNELGWWDKDAKTFNVSKMQEDLYLLLNRGKVHQKIANEAAAQRFVHHQKIQNNINLKGVANGGQPAPAQPDTKAQEHQMAEFLWKL